MGPLEVPFKTAPHGMITPSASFGGSSSMGLGHAWFALMIGACGPVGASPPPPPIVEPPPPAPDVIGAPLEVFVDALLGDPVDAAFAVPGDSILVSTGRAAFLVGSSTVTQLNEEPGKLVGVAPFEGGTLVAGERGLFVLVEGRLQRSPLHEALGSPTPTQLLRVPESDPAGGIWIAHTGGLDRWRAGQHFQISPGDLPASSAQLAYGAPVAGRPGVWVSASDALYGLSFGNEGIAAYLEPPAVGAGRLAVGERGTLWMVDASGALRSRSSDGVWRDHDALSDVAAISASPSGREVWILTMDALWVHTAGEFRRVSGVDAPAFVTAAGEGSALLGGPAGLFRIYDSLRVVLSGLGDGELLVARTEVDIHPALAAEVTSISAMLDGAPLDVQPAPARVTIDPEDLQDGSHALVVTARYRDGAEAQGSLRFSFFRGPPPNWTDDVHPISQARCALCHGPRQSARLLDSPALWIRDIDLILYNVRTGRMPLSGDPLNEAQVSAIEGWQAAGFPIGGE